MTPVLLIVDSRWLEAVPGTLHDLVARLVRLGLGQGAAETYLHLLIHGAIQPGALALAIRASRGEAYRRLQALAKMGLATASQERPITYRPAEPAAVFDILERSLAMRADEVEKVRAELQPCLEVFAGAGAATAGQTFRYLVGRPAFDDEVRQMLDRARDEVLILDTHPAGPVLAEQAGVWTHLRRLADRGIRFQVLWQDTAAARRCEAGRVRVLPPGKPMRFLIVDRSSMLVCIAIDPSDSPDAPLEKSMATSAPGFLAAHVALFERLWKRGDDVGLELRSTVHEPAAGAGR